MVSFRVLLIIGVDALPILFFSVKISTNNTKGGNFLYKKCAICKVEFKVKKSHYDKVFCCSKNCSKEYPLLKVIKKIENEKKVRINEYLHKEYTLNKRSYRWLVAELDINNRTVKRLLEKFNIPIRTGSEAVKTQWINNDERKKKSKEILKMNIMKLEYSPNELQESEIIERTEGTDFEYVKREGSKTIRLRCRKCSSETIKTPDFLLHNSICFECRNTSKGEEKIKVFLDENGIEYKKQVKFELCKNKNYLPFDFGIYDKGELVLLIEYDGKQHFNPSFDFGGPKDAFYKIRKNDSIKTCFCLKEGIPLLRIKYTDNVYDVLSKRIMLISN